MTYRILLADDQPMVRKYIKEILASGDNLEVVAEAGDGMELLYLLRTGQILPDLIITDISMPKLDGIAAVHQIKALHQEIRILILSVHRDPDHVAMALAAGASGYLVKGDADLEVLPAISAIRQGGRYLSASLLHEAP